MISADTLPRNVALFLGAMGIPTTTLHGKAIWRNNLTHENHRPNTKLASLRQNILRGAA
jgi:hypothetical protein